MPLDTQDISYKRLLLQHQEAQPTYQTHRDKNNTLDKMRQQKNIFPMKEQDKTLEEELSEVEIQSSSNDQEDVQRT